MSAVFDARSQCVGKRRYLCRVDARRSARSLMASGGDPMRAYWCAHCGFWHVGHRVEWETLASARQGDVHR